MLESHWDKMHQVQKQTEHKQDRTEVLIFLIYYQLFFPVFPKPVKAPVAKLLWTAKWEGRSFWLGTSVLKAISLALEGERSMTYSTGTRMHSRAAGPCVVLTEAHPECPCPWMAEHPRAVSTASMEVLWDTQTLCKSLLRAVVPLGS